MQRYRHLAVAMLAAILLTACGKEQPEPTAPTPAKPAGAAPRAAAIEVTTVDLDHVAKPAKPYRIALIVKTRNNPFFDPMIKAFEAEAKAMGAEADVQAPPQ